MISSNDDPKSSLLSLSIAAASVDPIPLPEPIDEEMGEALNGSALSTGTSIAAAVHQKHQRRLSSSGKARRRLSDAREAATRPNLASLQAPSALSLATLSLSSSPPSHAGLAVPTLASASAPLAIPSRRRSASISAGTEGSAPSDDGPLSKSGKKKGTEHICETCSKVYRHPSCLIKHRWEHTPHWREASKFVLSKHQQVQLLEAAAILSHLDPSSSNGTSLPEDRSLWPSFLSGGSLGVNDGQTTTRSPLQRQPALPVSSSVPVYSAIQTASQGARPLTTGPKLHDYDVPNTSVTQIRPGVLGLSTSMTSSEAVPIPISSGQSYRGIGSYGSPPVSLSYSTSSHLGGGGWSLPNSSVRSSSVSASSRSSDEEVEIDMETPSGYAPHGYSSSIRAHSLYGRKHDGGIRLSVREEEEDEDQDEDVIEVKPLHVQQEAWDGMDMDMDMD